jgi:hypothetical protein
MNQENIYPMEFLEQLKSSKMESKVQFSDIVNGEYRVPVSSKKPFRNSPFYRKKRIKSCLKLNETESDNESIRTE